MTGVKSQKGYLTDLYFRAGTLPGLSPFFSLQTTLTGTSPFVQTEIHPKIFQAAASTTTPAAPETKPEDKKSLVMIAQTGLRNFGYTGAIEGDWGGGSQAAFQRLVDLAQSSKEYQGFIAAGAKTKNGKLLTVDHQYGEYTLKALKAMAADGRLGDAQTTHTLISSIEKLKGGAPLAPQIAAAFAGNSTYTRTSNTFTPAPALTAPNTTAVFLGDSIAQGMGFAARDQKLFKSVINLGIPSSGLDVTIKSKTVADVPADVIATHPKAFLYYGTNDITNGKLSWRDQAGIDSYAKRLVEIAKDARAAGMTPLIYGVNIPDKEYAQNPAWNKPGFLANWQKTAEEVNKAYERECLVQGISFKNVQLAPTLISGDNLHPSAQGAGALVRAGLDMNV